MLQREWRRLVNRIVWSWAGWRNAWAHEPSLKFWTAMNVPSAGLALWLPLTRGETMVILMGGVLILAAELLNTAIENAVDYVSTDQNPLARRAKDAGSAGVAVAAAAAGIAWVAIAIG